MPYHFLVCLNAVKRKVNCEPLTVG